jgi:hypothetical protein
LPTQTSTGSPVSGCVTVRPVRRPSFSRVASSASVTPPRLHSSMKAASCGSLAAAAVAIGCSGATATKVTPRMVSARVVNTYMRPSPISAPCASRIACGNAKRTPVERPIQFSCISLTRSGQPRPSRSASSSSA